MQIGAVLAIFGPFEIFCAVLNFYPCRTEKVAVSAWPVTVWLILFLGVSCRENFASCSLFWHRILSILFSCIVLQGMSEASRGHFPGRSTTTLRRSIDRIEMIIESIESKKRKMPLLKELSGTSQDSLESASDSKQSWEVRLKSFKSCIFHFCHFWVNQADRPGIFSNWIPIRENPGTIGLIPSKVALRNFCVFEH